MATDAGCIAPHPKDCKSHLVVGRMHAHAQSNHQANKPSTIGQLFASAGAQHMYTLTQYNHFTMVNTVSRPMQHQRKCGNGRTHAKTTTTTNHARGGDSPAREEDGNNTAFSIPDKILANTTLWQPVSITCQGQGGGCVNLADNFHYSTSTSRHRERTQKCRANGITYAYPLQLLRGCRWIRDCIGCWCCRPQVDRFDHELGRRFSTVGVSLLLRHGVGGRAGFNLGQFAFADCGHGVHGGTRVGNWNRCWRKRWHVDFS